MSVNSKKCRFDDNSTMSFVLLSPHLLCAPVPYFGGKKPGSDIDFLKVILDKTDISLKFNQVHATPQYDYVHLRIL